MSDNRKYIQTQKFTLSASISLSDTSVALNSFNMPDGTAIVSGDLGSVNYATIEPGTSNEESISFTGLTSTTLTGVTRGLRFDAPYTQDTGLRKAHSAGAIVVLSNTAGFYDGFVNKNNDETIAGVHTYTAPNYPAMDSVASDPTDDEQLASKGYVDSILTGGTVTKTKEVIAGTAGETLAAGDIVYFDATDKEWKLADASATGTADNVILGIAQGAGTNGATISGGVLLSGLDTNQTGMTAGTKQFLSDTAGDIAESAGTVEVSLGTSNSGSTTDLIFQPTYDQKLTEILKTDLETINGATEGDLFYKGASAVAKLGKGSAGQVLAQNSGLTAPEWTSLTGFGGDGSDGALTSSSGTTTIDASSANVVVKNYTSISLTGTADLTLSNAASEGTILILKSQGDVTITSSASPAINLAGLGGDGAATNSSGNGDNGTQGYGIYSSTNAAGLLGTTSAGGAAVAALEDYTKPFYGVTAGAIQKKMVVLACGSGGASGGCGGAGTNTGGAGGSGGGAIYIEVGGALNITGEIDVSGTDGSDATRASGPSGGGGGGGSAGMALIVYNTLTADTGTYTAAGGAGGDSAQGTSESTGGGGGSGAGSLSSASGAGGNDDTAGSAAGGVGAGGGGAGGDSDNSGANSGGAAGATDSACSLVVANDIWA